ncbi:hypothetical protein LCGC14_3086030, partial [marine sediment metagenome]
PTQPTERPKPTARPSELFQKRRGDDWWWSVLGTINLQALYDACDLNHWDLFTRQELFTLLGGEALSDEGFRALAKDKARVNRRAKEAAKEANEKLAHKMHHLLEVLPGGKRKLELMGVESPQDLVTPEGEVNWWERPAAELLGLAAANLSTAAGLKTLEWLQQRALLVVYDEANLWVKGEWAADRANRQDIKNPPLLELGIRWWPTVDRIGDPQVNIVTSEPLVDVDTAADYRATTIPKTVALWPLADDKHGMGHLRRCLAIAERLQHHDVRWIDNDLDDAAQTILTDRGWSADRFGPCIETHPDLWILDRLDNHNLRHLPGKTVTLEDPSTYPADLKIDALYKISLV